MEKSNDARQRRGARVFGFANHLDVAARSATTDGIYGNAGRASGREFWAGFAKRAGDPFSGRSARKSFSPARCRHADDGLPGDYLERRHRCTPAAHLRRGLSGPTREERESQRNARQTHSRRVRRIHRGRRKESVLHPADLAHLEVSADRRDDWRSTSRSREAARVVHRISIPSGSPLCVERPRIGEDLGNRLANSAAVCARNVHGHAVLGAAAICG